MKADKDGTERNLYTADKEYNAARIFVAVAMAMLPAWNHHPRYSQKYARVSSSGRINRTGLQRGFFLKFTTQVTSSILLI
jgi:hypothetical protein